MDAQDLLDSVINFNGGECSLAEAIEMLDNEEKKELIRHLESTLDIDFEDEEDFDDINDEDSFEDET